MPAFGGNRVGEGGGRSGRAKVKGKQGWEGALGPEEVVKFLRKFDDLRNASVCLRFIYMWSSYGDYSEI